MGQAISARGTALCCALALGALALLAGVAPASADFTVCPPGEGAGQCGASQALSTQRGLAVDTEDGLLYVADEANNRVDVFEVDGDFLFAFGWKVNAGSPEEKLQTCTVATGCQKGSAGSGAGQFDRPSSVAVDNDGASSSHHDIYVGDRANFRVEKFDPSGEFVWTIGKEVNKTTNGDLCTKASGNTCGGGEQSEAEGRFNSNTFLGVGPGGVLYVLDNPRPGEIEQRLQRFEGTGAAIAPQRILFKGPAKFARAMAVDSAGNVWVGSQEEGLRKYEPDGTPLAGPIAETDFPYALAIDAAGNIYLSRAEENAGEEFATVTLYDSGGAIKRRFAYSPGGIGASSYVGLAAHAGASGELFLADPEAGVSYIFLPQPGPIVAPSSVKATSVGAAKATVAAQINPEGKATSFHFEYLTQAEWEGQGESFAGPATVSTEVKTLGSEDFKLKKVEAPIGCPDPANPDNTCLSPETTYRFQVVASNADNPAGAGPARAEGMLTTKEAPEIGEIYAIRVGTDTARLNGEVNPNSIPALGYFEYVEDAAYQADIAEAGDGFAAASKAPDIEGGQASLDFGAGEAFATRQATLYPLKAGTLYHYRLVADNPLGEPVASEPETLRTFETATVEPCANDKDRIGFGALLPDCRAYEMVSPPDKEGGDVRVLGAGLGALAVLEQASLAGEKLAYGSLRSFGGAASAPRTSQYIARRVAGVEWQTHSINSPRSKPILLPVQAGDTEFKAFSADLCEAWQTTTYDPPLAAGALTQYSNLYRRTDGLCGEGGAPSYEALAPIVVPEGVGSGEDFLLYLWGVSADGRHATLVTNGKLAAGGTAGVSQLYESVRGSAPRPVCILPGGAAVGGSCTGGSGESNENNRVSSLTGAISEDGERIFWSAPSPGEGKLYVRIGGAQTVAVSKAGEEAKGTSQSWFWGAARADGSTAIFSTGNLPSGSATLYEFDVDGEATTQIAEGVQGVLGMSADASRVYFASGKVLSEEANGNGDKAQAGKANLYLHEAGGGTEFIGTLAGADLPAGFFSPISREALAHSARVTPDGLHAVFASFAPLTGYDNSEASATACPGSSCKEIYRYDATSNELLCVSCNPSEARPGGAASIPGLQTGSYGARLLSDAGSRLYFQSSDALAARDTNGKVDVYQWEEPGTGGCEEAASGFSAKAGGCIELISSGQSPQDSRFVEASPTGEDVFFATVASLLPQDIGVFDIYDARVGGGLPIPAVPPPPCEGDACAPQIAAPEEPTPASSDYTPPAAERKSAKRCGKGKRRVTRKGKSRCVARQHKKQRRAR
jgi:hypothetical protein